MVLNNSNAAARLTKITDFLVRERIAREGKPPSAKNGFHSLVRSLKVHPNHFPLTHINQRSRSRSHIVITSSQKIKFIPGPVILLRQRIQHGLRHGLDFIPVLLARLDHLAQILLLLGLLAAAVPIAVGSSTVAIVAASVPVPVPPSVVLVVSIVVLPAWSFLLPSPFAVAPGVPVVVRFVPAVVVVAVPAARGPVCPVSSVFVAIAVPFFVSPSSGSWWLCICVVVVVMASMSIVALVPTVIVFSGVVFHSVLPPWCWWLIIVPTPASGLVIFMASSPGFIIILFFSIFTYRWSRQRRVWSLTPADCRVYSDDVSVVGSRDHHLRSLERGKSSGYEGDGIVDEAHCHYNRSYYTCQLTLSIAGSRNIEAGT
ncbi:hypothetical protein KC325_g269 [Hortaea werneckii]|nr:hypothetical protein KC325_g269 [Hortaea werneckii]